MRAIIPRVPFLEAFDLCTKVASRKPTRPVLRSVLMTCQPEGCTLVATDLEIGVRRHVPGVRIEADGNVMLPGDPVGLILSLQPDETLEVFTQDDGALTIQSPSTNAWYALQTEDSTSFPAVSDTLEGLSLALPAADLRDLIRLTSFAVDAKSTRYALGGCLVESGVDVDSGPFLRLVATDGRCLAMATTRCEASGKPPTMSPSTPRPVIPARALKLMLACLGDEESVALTIGSAAVLLRAGPLFLASRLLEGRFPDYRRAMPETRNARIRLDSGPFRRAVEQAATMTDDLNSRSVRFRFGGGEIVMQADAADVGASRVSLPVVDALQPLEIMLDPHYLNRAMDVLGDDASIFLDLIDGKSPAVIRVEGWGLTCVVMPTVKDI